MVWEAEMALGTMPCLKLVREGKAHHVDAVVPQFLGGADAAELQNLGRVRGASCHHHLAASLQRRCTVHARGEGKRTPQLRLGHHDAILCRSLVASHSKNGPQYPLVTLCDGLIPLLSE